MNCLDTRSPHVLITEVLMSTGADNWPLIAFGSPEEQSEGVREGLALGQH